MMTNKDNTRIAKNTVILYVRMLLVMLVTLYTSRIILQSLGVQDFGIYNVVGGVVSMFTIMTGSLSQAVSRYFTYELGVRNYDRLSKIFSTALVIHIILAIFVLILGETLGSWFLNTKMNIPSERAMAANWVLQTSIYAFIFGLIRIPYNAAIIAYERMDAFAYLGIAEVVFKLIIAELITYILYDHLITYSCLQLLLNVVLTFAFILFGGMRLRGCAFRLQINLQLLKELLNYSSWSFFGTLAYSGYTYGYNILLNMFFDPFVNAARGIAVQVQTAVESFSNNFQASLNPQIIKNYSVNNLERMHNLIVASSKYSFYLMLILSLPLILEANFVLRLWLGQVPAHSVNFVRLILVTVTISCLSGSMICSNQATGKIKKFELISGLLMTASVLVCYIVLKFGNSPESVYVVYLIFTIMTLIVRAVIVFPMIKFKYKLYFSKVLKYVFSVALLSIPIPIVVYWKNAGSSFVDFILVCFVSICSTVLTIYVVGIDNKERNFVNSKIIKILRK